MAIPPLIFDRIREKFSGSQAQRSFLFCSNCCCVLRCLPKQAVSSGHQWRGGRRQGFLLGLCADPSLPDGPCVSAHWPSPSCSQRLSDHPAIPNALSHTHDLGVRRKCGGRHWINHDSCLWISGRVCGRSHALPQHPTHRCHFCLYIHVYDRFISVLRTRSDRLAGRVGGSALPRVDRFVSMMSPDLSQILPRGCTLTCAIIHVPTHTHTHTFEHL